jgi:hypothetical protein
MEGARNSAFHLAAAQGWGFLSICSTFAWFLLIGVVESAESNDHRFFHNMIAIWPALHIRAAKLSGTHSKQCGKVIGCPI